MTKHFLTLLMLAGISATAQPTITGAGVNPIVGQTTDLHATSLPSVGSAGANVTWNFANIPDSATHTNEYIACSAAPDCSQMTGTDVVAHNTSSSGSYVYYIANGSTQGWRGAEVNNVVFDYSDPEDYLHFPFTYNSTFTDSFEATFTSGMAFTRKGETIVTADAYGTLILPTGTYNNVIRVHRISNYVDITMGTPFFEYVSENYQWYQQGNKDALLSRASTSIAGTPILTVDFYTDLTPVTGVSSLPSDISAISLYPNPATDVMHVRFQNERTTTLALSLLDVTGRRILNLDAKEYQKGACQESINVAHLPKGVYILQLTSGAETASRRIEVL